LVVTKNIEGGLDFFYTFIYDLYLKAKEELWKLKYFTMQKYNLQKNPIKETKIVEATL
jgi:hypothetical protein